MPLFLIVSEIYGLKSRNGENIGWNNRPVLSACNDGELRNRFVPHSAWRILQGMKLNLCNAAFWMYTISTNDRPRSAANFIAIDFVLVIQSHSCTAVCCMCRPRATPGARNAVWIVYVCDCVSNYLNPLMGTLNTAQQRIIAVIGTHGRWWWAVTFGTVRPSPSSLTKCNIPPIKGLCTNFILFDVAL